MTTFNSLGLSKPVLKAVQNMGFEEATPIQEQTIPIAMAGKDLIGQAQTGTGKTAAFGIPLVEKINPDVKRIQALVITPTRELAVQVAQEVSKLGQFKGVRALSIYGGENMGRQIRALKDKPQIVVATPGRLLDHIRRKTIDLAGIHTTILDEADEMLNMGFIDDIRDILKSIPETRQTLLFSATMPKEIQDIGEKMMKNPETIRTKSKQMTVENIEQFFVEVSDSKKFDTLSLFLDIHDPALAIIFGRTKKRVDEITEGLQARGFRAEGIHGDLTQAKRLSVLKQFKSNRIDVLVATDVAARGLDISGVSHVYNFDIPQDPESYVHRIGRTGRAGNKGVAVSFITPREIGHLNLIEKTTKSKMQRAKMPTTDEAVRGQQQMTIDKLGDTIEKNDLKNYRQAASELLDNHDSVTVVAAALKLLTKERRDVPVKLSGVQPISVRRSKGGSDKKRNYGGKGKRSYGGKKDNQSGNRSNFKKPSRNRKFNNKNSNS